MPVPDARTRKKISLNPTKVLSTSIPSRYIPNILLSNVLVVLSLHAAKEWLLDLDVGVFWVVMRVLACGGLGVLVWEGCTGQMAKRKTIEWSVLGMASLLLFVKQAALFTALFRLSSNRVIIFTHFSTLWMGALLSMTSARKSLFIGLALLISISADTRLFSTNSWRIVTGYGALAMHALTSSALDSTVAVLSPSLGSTFTMALTTLGATISALPFYFFRMLLPGFPTEPTLPLLSLAAIPVIAYALLFFAPITGQTLAHLSFTPQYFKLSYPTIAVISAVLGALAFTQFPGWSDLFVASFLYAGMFPENVDTFAGPPRTPTARLLKSYLKTILSNPESRKIFYFLCLNMCYMLVQMLYGVWTNSLGLISDAIHMAFDCMAIGVGLFASVMATWEPNERFTYGYGRIETLSGFANGIFLILISIFIMFEAIQRLLDPPEMNTSQLLLVSSLGLAVNLFGMFAMGGHHHHGGHSHSHSHGHGHTHSADDSHSHSLPPPSALSRSHSHSSDHSHSHSHSPSPPPIPAAHTRAHSHSHSDSHSHSPEPTLPPSLDSKSSHTRSKSHSHSHSPPEHSHSLPNSHSHPPSHSRSQSQVEFPSTTSYSTGNSAGPTSPTRRHFRGPSIQIHPVSPASLGPGDDDQMPIRSPLSAGLTPSYKFVHDEHLSTHHSIGHTHSHSSAHEGHSDNMRGVFLHVMADTLGSVGVIISTLLIQFYGWTGFDPIASMFIAVLIAASVIPLVLDTGKVLALDVSNRDTAIQQALAELSSIEGLASYTEPRFWPKDASNLIGSIHIQLSPSASSIDPGGPHSSQRTTYTRIDRVVERVDGLLRQKIPGLEELTIQVEEGKR
ncbi:putative cation efflux family protein [Lyophyllum shimeji]|uniref:Cation efflux family protein n=1 Tax=Lyophyllum shimeji TaxID=47721 RepID=A0A9P3PXK2_LYOSH|nr:putative cation efflux family protein [Lyophyllum shimeji]